MTVTASAALASDDVRRGVIETLYRAFNTGEPDLLDGVLTED